MSVDATAWAWRQIRDRGLSATQGLILVRVADHADQEGVCWPGVEGLAEWTGRNERTVRRCLDDFEERGMLRRERRENARGRGRRSDLIRLNMDGDQPDISPGRSDGDQPDISSRPTGHLEHDQPDISSRPYIDGRTTSRTVSENKRPPDGGPATVGKKPVTDREREIAQAALDAFNAQLGSSYTPLGYFAPIIRRVREESERRRVREEPDLGPSDHAGLVEVSFRKPWWRNDERPTPKVIYGNRAVFEGALERWKHAGEPVQVRAHCERSLTGAQQEKWDRAMGLVAKALPESTYQIWIRPLVAASATEDSVTVLAPARISGWVERRYSGLLADALSRAVGKPMRIEVKTATFADEEPGLSPPNGAAVEAAIASGERRAQE